jgi:flavin reductase (DIM6/NTAB) family NADH-FMN oxidoreductase RutF
MQYNIQENLKAFMRMFPQGVTVVTTILNGTPGGITVSAFTSISLNPPLIMVAISKDSAFHDVLIKSKIFAVNLLSKNDKEISERFAGKYGNDKFNNINYKIGKLGAPILNDALAVLECNTWRTYDGGDHTIFIGEVLNITINKQDLPLVYYNRGYTTLANC